ncbi:MAG: class I SAM-dependent methyltransferase family protein [Candidatus Micrarchaeaceae archaeon]
MLGIKVKKQYAQKVKNYLLARTLLDNNHNVISSNYFIYFPIKTMNKKELFNLEKNFGIELVNKNFEQINSKKSYKELLKNKFGKRYEEVPRGFEVLGNMAIINCKKNLASGVASSIMEVNPNIKTVIRKLGAVKGRYRKRRYEHVSGIKTYVVTYKENNAVFKFDLRDTFFSTRLAYERKRITELSKGPENVMVMFAGVGPFAIELGLSNKSAKIVAIELNKKATLYMKKNIELNKVKNVTAESGDVKKKALLYKNFADRIIMPLPKDSMSFLDEVCKIASKNCIIHYYAFVNIDNGLDILIKDLKMFFNKKGFSFKVMFSRTVRPYSPEVIEVVLDFKISRK